MKARIIVALGALLATSPTLAGEREWKALQAQNREKSAELRDELGHDAELLIRSMLRNECRNDRLRLDIATCNRLSGMDGILAETERKRRAAEEAERRQRSELDPVIEEGAKRQRAELDTFFEGRGRQASDEPKKRQGAELGDTTDADLDRYYEAFQEGERERSQKGR